MNSFGNIFSVTSFGESHGPAIGGVVDGVPAGIEIDESYIQRQLDRRRPGQSHLTTSRPEADKVTLLSGIFNGRTTGTPIGFTVANSQHNSADYDNLARALRPSHADFTYMAKYGIRDHRGGGRSSARETIARVVAGAIARKALEELGVTITAFTSAVGEITSDIDPLTVTEELVETSPTRCPDPAAARLIENLILDVKAKGDTVGGVITCAIKGVPAGLGEPVFDRLQAMLAHAMLSINAAHGFDYGMGFDGAQRFGSQVIDQWKPDSADPRGIRTLANNSGGIQGGISNGEPILFRVAFKPVATLLRDIETVDIDGKPVTVKARGRHDPCVVPRAVPIVEAMAAITILDAWLLNRARSLR